MPSFRPQVGDEVVLGVSYRAGFLRPIYDWHVFRMGSDPQLQTAIVRETNSDNFRIEYAAPDGRVNWTFPYDVPVNAMGTAEDLAAWWPRPAAPAAPTPDPTWEESVEVGRNMQIPDSVLAAMIDRGERGVRRCLRAWPHGQQLVHAVEHITGAAVNTVRVRWYWQEIPEK